MREDYFSSIAEKDNQKLLDEAKHQGAGILTQPSRGVKKKSQHQVFFETSKSNKSGGPAAE